MKLLLPLALALSLPGCAGLITPPATVANQTILDEKLAIGAEQGYQAATMAVLAVNEVRPFSAAQKDRIKAADRRAYEALVAVRAAYRAGNAGSYAMAVAEVQAAIASLLDALN